MKMVIDANMYWFPERFFTDEEKLERFLAQIPMEYNVNAYCTETEGGLKQIVLERPKGYESLNYVQGEYRLEKQLEDMDKAGIDKAVLKLPGCHEFLDLDMCREFNTLMAEHAKRSGGRLSTLAAVPSRGTPSVLRELHRCFNELGMKGVQMCAHYGDLYLDDELFAPLFKVLNEMEAAVYVHHTPVPVECSSLYDYNNLRRSYGRCVDQMTAIGRELFSGFFDKYPKLKMIHSMLGGGFFAYAGLMLPKRVPTAEKVSRFSAVGEGIERALQDNLFFEMSHAQPWGKEQLECAVKTLGAEHIIFGSSYPVHTQWLSAGADFINNLDITANEKAQILGLNARKLYGV